MSRTINSTTIGIVLLMGFAILFSTAVQAQSQRMSVEDRVKMLKDSLKLNDEQCTGVTKILEDQREEMTTAMNEHRDDRDAMQAARLEITKKADDKVKALLTDDQKVKYESMIKSRRARMGQRTQ
jgi:periplasmic protein CpxP/Spy